MGRGKEQGTGEKITINARSVTLRYQFVQATRDRRLWRLGWSCQSISVDVGIYYECLIVGTCPRSQLIAAANFAQSIPPVAPDDSMIQPD